MLVLQRKKEETLLIGDDIQISIVDIGGDSVKLAIEAPSDVRILRKELVEAAEVNKEAAVDVAQLEKMKNMVLKNL